MKKIIFWILGISIICLVVGLSIASYTGGYAQKKRIIDISKSVSIEDIDYLKLQSSSANIIVKPTDEKEISVHYYGVLKSSSKDDPTVDSSRVGKELMIKSGMQLGFMWSATANFDDFRLEVKVPSSYQKRLEVKTNFGDIEVDSLNLEKLITSTGSYGNIIISNCQGEQEVNLTLGDIKITDRTLSSNKTIKSTFGNVNLFLPKESDFSFIYDTKTGDLTTLFSANLLQNTKEHIAGTVGEGKNNIYVSTSSGNLSIGKSN